MEWQKPELESLSSVESASAGCANGSVNDQIGGCTNGSVNTNRMDDPYMPACATGTMNSSFIP